jgi:hypothetical protein
VTPGEKASVQQAVLLDQEEQVAEMLRWWKDTAAADADRTVPKAVEYSSWDLEFIGSAIMEFNSEKWAGCDAAERRRISQELGATFYAMGKIARAMSAFAAGKIPSDDTPFDGTVYQMMIRRIRETGTWVQ